MSEAARPARERAEDLMGRAGTWHEFRGDLDAAGLVEELGPEGMQDLLDLWHQRAAGALNDIELRIELGFWAHGGTYAQHLRGYQAIPPAALVAQARARGWFVRVGESGNAVVNPPGARPLALRLGPN